MKCNACEFTCILQSACGVSWFLTVLVYDVAAAEKYKHSLQNDQVHELCGYFHISLESFEDDVVKGILEITEPIRLTFDVTQQIVNVIKFL